YVFCVVFFFSSRRRHTRFKCDWSSDVCSSDLRKLKYDLVQHYSDDEDNKELRKKYFPFIIAPTENDWQHPPHLNRVLKAGAARRSEERRVGKEYRTRKSTCH